MAKGRCSRYLEDEVSYETGGVYGTEPGMLQVTGRRQPLDI